MTTVDGHALSTIMQMAQEPIIIVSENYIIIDINRCTENTLRIKKNQMIGTSLKDHCPIKELKKLANTHLVQITILINNEKYSCYALIVSEGQSQIRTKTDLSKLKHVQEHHNSHSKYLTENLNYLELIIAEIPVSIYWMNRDYIYLGCSNSMAKLLNLPSRYDIVGKTYTDLYDKKSANFYRKSDKSVMEDGISLSIEEPLYQKDGTKLIYLSEKVPLHDSKGTIIGMLGISTNITERKKMEMDIRLAKEAAEAADRAKTAFMANMSHDIRTPLSGVIEMSEMLERNLENQKHKQEAHLLSMSGSQLLKMLNEILEDVRAGNTDKASIQEETFDVHQCIQGLMELEAPSITMNHLGLQCDIQESVPRYIVSDRKKIHHILLNLLGNAIKFTRMGNITIQVICLDCTKTRAHLQFSIADTGIGIPKKLQKKIFEHFFRIDPSYKGRYEGYGLGLNIVQSYVNLLGGHITLTSKEGIGTTFHFDLPCKIGKKEDIPQKYTLETAAIPSQNNPAVPEISNTLHTTASDEKNVHILLVEDNVIALKTLELMVTEAGYRFTSASTGEQALELVKSEKFDLIITDVGLPGMSGIMLAQSIQDWEKKNDKTTSPIVALTGHGQEAIGTAEWRACGIKDVVTKPIRLATLQSMVSQWVSKTVVEHRNSTIKKNSIYREESPSKINLPDINEKLFDLDSFLIFDPNERLKSCKMDVLIQILKLFLSDVTQNDIHLIEQAYLKNDRTKIIKLAHKIKGSAEYAGLCRLSVACRYMELYCKTKQDTLLKKLYSQLLAVNTDTVKTIKAWLDKYNL